MDKLFKFIKSHYPIIFLILYGVFIILFRAANGSFDCDEAIYSQIAREGLAKNSFFSLYWMGQHWFEKSPLMIWATMLSFRLFGISEFSAHIFSGIFGLLGAVSAYLLGKEIFGNKVAGFFSGFILLSMPLFIWSMRSNMMDTALSFFITVSILAFWKATKGNSKWILLFWFAIGLAVMTKSILGLFPCFVAVVYSLVKRQDTALLKNRYFYIGFVAFLFIVLPWHLFMSLQYGKLFWNAYLGFHVFNRFTSSILHTPWDNNPFAYIEIFFQRSGVWSIIFVILLIPAVRIYKGMKSNFLFLGIWVFSYFLLLSVSKTKFPHYFIPAYIPLALIIGGLLSSLIQRKSKFLIVIALASLLNFLPFFFLSTSGYGESQLFVTKFLMYFFHFGNTQLVYTFVICAIILIFLIFKLSRSKLTSLSILVIISMFLIMPFSPQRSEFIKSTGIELAKINGGLPLNIYLSSNKVPHLKEVLPFYLPLGSKIERHIGEDFAFMNNISNPLYCFFEKQAVADKSISSAVFSNQGYIVIPCHEISHESPPF